MKIQILSGLIFLTALFYFSCNESTEFKDARKPEPTFEPGDCNEVVFEDDVLPLLSSACVSCHPGYDKFETAKTKIDAFIKRVNLSEGDPLRMPKIPNPVLSGEDKKVFSDWKDQGLKKDCDDETSGQNPHLDLDYIEAAIQNDLKGLSSGDQASARYLLTTHKSNEGVSKQILKQFANGINKGINSLSFSRNIVLAVAVDEYKTVWRFLLKDIRISAADWRLIEDADPINFESFTNVGQLNKFLAKTRKPFMHVDTFNFTSFQAEQYYKIRKLPITEGELFDDIGLDFDRDIEDFDAIFLGFNNSPISLGKPRLIAGFGASDGKAYVTFDSLLGQNDPARNPFERPLVKAPSGNNLVFDGSETIYSLPNGLLAGFFLADGLGKRVDEAPVDLVSDNISPFSPIINILSCSQCHNAGFIVNRDEILNHVLENASSFDLDDVEFVKALYRPAGSRIVDDSAEHLAAMARMGISGNDQDPINQTANNLRRNIRSNELAAFLFIRTNELIDGISRSASLKASIGQLVIGGDVTFEVLKQVMPTLLKDLRIGQEPLIPE